MLRSLLLGCLLALTPVMLVPLASAATDAGSTSVPSNLIGLGATTAQWNANHLANKKAGSGNYGPMVAIPGGTGGTEWSALPTNGRILGFDYTMSGGTHLARAKHLVLKQLPADATTTSPMWNLRDTSGDTCLVWNLRSSQLGQILASSPWNDSAGTFSVRLMSSVGRNELQLSKSGDGVVRLDTNNIDFAVISIQTVGRYSTCTTILNG